MNTNLSIKELSLDDLNSVSGGEVKGAIVGMLVQYAADTVMIYDQILKLLPKKDTPKAPPPK